MKKNENEIFRLDYDVILNLVEFNSKVLDLGCGDGELLYRLKKEKNCLVRGVEISTTGVVESLEKGLSVYQGDINEGLKDYPDKSFDYVILSYTLQELLKPELVLNETLRVGKKVIVSFPNFGNWKIRLYLLLKGRMPKSKILPFEWYNTPNIHLITIKDFRIYCMEKNIKVLKEIPINLDKRFNQFLVNRFRNLFAQFVIYLIYK
ncbi:MAG TPA: methionine biosynthesis protein MetW [bacterium]|nr:methionine biosynthesis protein MetW [bacterium]HOL48592.1 methionine biosynthesis protein MetW [bacterium]HPQ18745.1 methionine biosynthesis protein MetW [bacterium]